MSDVAFDRENLLQIIAKKDEFIARLQEQLKLALLRQFGRKADTYIPLEQGCLFESSELDACLSGESVVEATPETIEVPAHERNKSRGKREPLPSCLSREERTYELPAADLVGPEGEIFEKIGEEVSEQLEIIPADIKVIRHIRFKYAVRTREELGVKIAPMPPQMLPKSLAASGLLAHMVQAKFEHHLPLYRQESIWADLGVEIPRSSMSRWTNDLGEKLQPLISRLLLAIKQTGYIHADETPVTVIEDPHKKAGKLSHTGRIWVYLNESIGAFYDYRHSREGKHPREVLEGFEGYLQVDGYSAYDALCSDKIIQVGCMAHIRRKFTDVQKLGGKKYKTPVADYVVEQIRRLYELESKMKKVGLSPEDVFRERQEKAKPILESLHEYLKETRPKAPPKGKLGEALGYALNHWGVTLNYLEDGRLDIDNNAAERAIKPFAVGRKNWLFSHQSHGAEASANLYSLVQSAKLQGLNVFRYLKAVFEAFPTAATEEELDALLPHRLAKANPELKKSQDPEPD